MVFLLILVRGDARPAKCQKGVAPCRTDAIVRPMSDERRVRFETVVSIVGEPLRRYAARRTDPETAQDVVADSFLVIWRRLDDVPDGGELPWCYAVARNCLANAQRSARRQRGLLLRLARLDPPRPAPDASQDLPDEALHRALAALGSNDRELLRLWAWEELRPAEIAVVLETTTNAVNIRLHRARRLLAARLEVDTGKSPLPSGQKQGEEGRTA